MKTLLIDAAHTSISATGELLTDVLDLVASYDNPKLVVTNANPEEAKQYKLNTLPYGVYSLNHEPDKTDPLYFERLMDEFGLEPEDIVYFEHTPAAVKAAQSLKITSYHFDEIKRDIEALKAFLDANL